MLVWWVGLAVLRASVRPSWVAIFWRRLVRPCSWIFEFFMSFMEKMGWLSVVVVVVVGCWGCCL